MKEELIMQHLNNLAHPGNLPMTVGYPFQDPLSVCGKLRSSGIGVYRPYHRSGSWKVPYTLQKTPHLDANGSDNGVTHLGRHPFADNYRHQNQGQDYRYLGPGQNVQ